MGKTPETQGSKSEQTTACLETVLKSPGVNRNLEKVAKGYHLSKAELGEWITDSIQPFRGYLEVHNKWNKLSPAAAECYYEVFVALVAESPTPMDARAIRQGLRRKYGLTSQELRVITQKSSLKFYTFLVERIRESRLK